MLMLYSFISFCSYWNVQIVSLCNIKSEATEKKDWLILTTGSNIFNIFILFSSHEPNDTEYNKTSEEWCATVNAWDNECVSIENEKEISISVKSLLKS